MKSLIYLTALVLASLALVGHQAAPQQAKAETWQGIHEQWDVWHGDLAKEWNRHLNQLR